jgi:hypothetical protein
MHHLCIPCQEILKITICITCAGNYLCQKPEAANPHQVDAVRPSIGFLIPNVLFLIPESDDGGRLIEKCRGCIKNILGLNV